MEEKMRVIDSCAKCLLDRQIARANKNADKEKANEYIKKVTDIIENRKDDECSPYLVSVFNEIYADIFGAVASYADIKKEYNDLVLSMEADLSGRISDAKSVKDSLAKAVLYGRLGNYIDFGAMSNVDKNTFLGLFDDARLSEADLKTFEEFYNECANAKSFLLLTDNCGEIVLDKLFIQQLKKCFPLLDIKILVRGQEVLNDATMEDAVYVGIEKEAKVIENGTSVAGTIYKMITDEARQLLDNADVVLAKGQGNYESMSGISRKVYYSFLCKCDLFTSKFNVPLYTGMFISE